MKRPQLKTLVFAIAFFAFTPAAPALAACPCTLFSDVSTPAAQNLPVQDGRSGTGPFSYELGVKVTVDQPAQLSAIRFYKDSLETGVHTGKVWTSTGTLLTQVGFSGETASGWQVQALPTPLALQAGTVYVVSVNANATFGITGAGLATAIVSGPLHSVADGQNGVFGSAAGIFPNQSFNSTNYFVDLRVDTLAAAPTVTAFAPAAGATGVGTGATVSATFSRAMDPATITTASWTLKKPDGSTVPATVAYDGTTSTATLTPSAALAPATTYTAALDTTVKAADGTALASPVSWSFTTQNAAPTVTAKSPADGATGVSTGTAVSATFSRAMDATTLTGTSFTLTGPGGSVAASVSYEGTTNTATLTPAAALAAGTTYTAALAATVKAADGVALASPVSWSFTTQTPAPTVTAKSPADGATGVSTGTAVSATFSRAMNPATLTSTSFTLAGPGGAVAASVSYDAATTTATLTPTAALAAGTTYTATLAATAKAADGVALAAAVSWSFTTQSPAPTVTAKSPADGATGVSTGTAVSATFSRAMNASSITTSSFTLTGPAGAVAANVAYNATTNVATLTPSAALAAGTTYTAALAATVKAADGVALAGPVSWSFTTQIPAPTVTAKSPADGATGVSTGTAVSATFSRAMNASSITTSSFTLTGPSGPVGALVTYDATAQQAVLTPSLPLAFSATYTARLDATVASSDGVALGTPVSWSFTTAAAPAPPAVTATTPANGATGVATGVHPTATFSRAMDPATITSASWTLKKPDGTAVAASVAYDSATTTATLTPGAALDPSVTYTAALDATVKAADGTALSAPVSWSFTTAAASAPTVTTTSPTGTNVVVTSKVKATFSRAMDATTITSSSFTLKRNDDGLVPATVAYDSTTNTVTLTPTTPLPFAKSYTATLATTIKAADGAALSGAVTWTFTTQDATRINAGGGAYTTSAGKSFLSDSFVSGGQTNAVSSDISGTTDPALYQNERWGQFSYAIPVPNGTYDVRLHFAELYYGTVVPGSCVGKRIFGIDILDTTVSPDIANLDICAQVGPNAALVKTVSAVPVTDGVLNVKSVYGAVDDPELTAIEVVPAAAAPPPTSPPTVVATTPRDGATGAGTLPTIRASFSRAMDPATITSTSFTLNKTGDGAVASSVSYDSTTNTATLTPAGLLAYSTSYTASLAATIKATDGTPLAAAVTWSFTTQDATRIDVGGPGYVSSAGKAFAADTYFSGGSTNSVTTAISGTSDAPLFQTERYGQFSYAIPVPNGTYTVNLSFAELYYGTVVPGSCVGARVFGMDVVNTIASPDIASLDICAAVGPNAALVKTVSGVTVSDGVLRLQSVPGTSDPELTAIEVVPSGPPSNAPTVKTATPAGNATGVANTTTVTAAFSKAMTASTITGSSFTLAPVAGPAVPATVTYNATTNKATLTPSSPLALATTYTATLAGSIAATDGTSLAPVSWTFTTVDAIRINSGDGNDVASTGKTFLADSFFTGGSTYASTSAVSGTPDPELFQNERWGQFTYAIPVSNGTYTVKLEFVELYYGTAEPGAAGKRVFGMDILDTPASPDIANLDIYAEVGPNAALVKTITGVQVTDGKLSIKSVYGSADDPEIAAIEVLPG